VSLGSLYNNFGSRAGLDSALAGHRLLQHTVLWADRDDAVCGDSGVGRVHAAAEAYLRLHIDDPRVAPPLAGDSQLPDTPGCRATTDALAARIAEQNRHLARAVLAAIDEGTLRPVDARDTATLLWATWNGVLALARRPDQLRATEQELRDLYRAATTAILHGLRGTSIAFDADTRTTFWGARVPGAILRDFLKAWIRDDTLCEWVCEHVFGGEQPRALADSLRAITAAILESATPEDWEQVAADLFDAAWDFMRAEQATPPQPAPALPRPPAATIACFDPRDDAKARGRRATAQRIIRAVEGLLRESPDRTLTPAVVAARANVAMKTVYQQFGDTPRLIAAVHTTRALSLPALWGECGRTGASAREQIVAAANEYLCLALEHPDALRSIVLPRDPGDRASCQELTDALAERVAGQCRLLARTIARGAHDGSIVATDPQRAARILWATWNGIAGLAWRSDALRTEPDDLRRLLMQATDTLLRGLPPTRPDRCATAS
jgi:TetR/AcrR family transcriptional regulator